MVYKTCFTCILIHLQLHNGHISNKRRILRKEALIRSFSRPYFPAYGLNTEIYLVNLLIQSKCGKIRSRKTPNLEAFHAVIAAYLMPGAY